MLDVLDFARLLAYVIPGLVLLQALTLAFPNLTRRVLGVREVSSNLADAATTIVVAFILGIVISTVRASTIDLTFGWDLTLLTHDPQAAPYLGQLLYVYPDYTRLSTEGRLAAFNEMYVGSMRASEFYGNLMIAFPVGAALYRYAHPIKTRHRRLKHIAFVFGTVLLFSTLFYLPARAAFHRYVQSVTSFNRLEVP